jgi:YrbI family 3-deoxy-D-manno-octulosonate 8-phosphate phosphatase
MVTQAEVLAIVPARGGSKSIPRKNIKPLGGVPLIAYSIAAGLQAQTVHRVIVSTDDEEIAAVARAWGAEVPFMRPPELAEDSTPDLPVFQHALRWLEDQEGYVPEVVVQLRPTSPLRPPDCVDAAVATLLSRDQADSVRGVIPSEQNPYKMWRLANDGTMQPLLGGEFTEPYNMPRQALPQTYWQTGHIDAIRYRTIVAKSSLTGDRILPLFLDAQYAIDIDTPLDWERAEWTLAQLEVPLVRPPDQARRQPLAGIRFVVLDFDGVLTDNRVWVGEDGHEWVAANRSDGLGLSFLKQHGVEVLVLSKEPNPVVSARCHKMGVACRQGIDDKEAVLRAIMGERDLDWAQVAYVGNDVNDLGCMRLVGCSVAVADAHPAVLAEADLVLSRCGGYGAVRELCDKLLEQQARRP